MKRERRLLIGKQLHEGSLSAPDCMKKYGVAYTCVCSWRREYEESAGLERPRKGKPIKVPECFFRQKRKVLQLPFFIFHIVGLWIDQSHQMSHTPGNDILLVFYVTVVASAHL